MWFDAGAHRPARPTEKIAVWTTTPWTLPSNLALAVGPDVPYAVLERDGEKAYVGEARLGHYAKELEGWTRTGTVTGAELVGRRYTPLFDFLVEQAGPNAYQVLAADFVTTEDGTGVVHCRSGVRRGRPDRSATRPASRPWSPWTTTPSSPRWCRRTRACRSSRPTSR